jgi:hypothetical protein
MNEPCTIEAGLFKKKPCGLKSVTKCATCEQPLCATHAVPQKKGGVFMCKECDDAAKRYDKDQAKAAKEKRDADMMKSLANPNAPKPKQSYTQPAPAAPATPAAGAAKPGAAAAAPAAAKPAPADAPLEFTPAAGAAKPGTAAAAPAAAKPVPAAAPAAAKPVPADAPLEFTPSKPKPADDAPLEFKLDDEPKK